MTPPRKLSLALTPEARVVARYLRDHFGGRETSRQEALPAGTGVADFARKEGLSGFVLSRLPRSHASRDALSSLELARLRVFGGAMRTIDLMESLGSTLAALGIAATVLKGGALLATIYRDHLDWRPLSDLDLLALPATPIQVQGALKSIGFRYNAPVWCRDGLEVDLHEDLLGCAVTGRRHGPFRFDDALLRSQSVPSPIGRPGLCTLTPELQFLHAAVHALRHDYRRWVWVLDLGLLLRNCRWQMLCELARKTRTERPLAYALFACDQLLGDPIAGDRRSCERSLLRPLGRCEDAYLRMALGRPSRVHLGEAIAALGHQRWLRRLACWIEMARPSRELLELRLPLAPSETRRRRWRASMLKAALVDGLCLLSSIAQRIRRARLGIRP